jgi:hypothetical protein
MGSVAFVFDVAIRGAGHRAPAPADGRAQPFSIGLGLSWVAPFVACEHTQRIDRKPPPQS